MARSPTPSVLEINTLGVALSGRLPHSGSRDAVPASGSGDSVLHRPAADTGAYTPASRPVVERRRCEPRRDQATRSSNMNAARLCLRLKLTQRLPHGRTRPAACGAPSSPDSASDEVVRNGSGADADVEQRVPMLQKRLTPGSDEPGDARSRRHHHGTCIDVRAERRAHRQALVVAVQASRCGRSMGLISQRWVDSPRTTSASVKNSPVTNCPPCCEVRIEQAHVAVPALDALRRSRRDRCGRALAHQARTRSARR